jgi:hypothetical protein
MWHEDPMNDMKYMKAAIDHYVSADIAEKIRNRVFGAVDKMIARSNNQLQGGSKGKSRDDSRMGHGVGNELVELSGSISRIAVDNLLCKPSHKFLQIV